MISEEKIRSCISDVYSEIISILFQDRADIFGYINSTFAAVTGTLPGLLRNLHRILSVKTCFAKRKPSGHSFQIISLHISKRISADHLTYFFFRMTGCYQLVIGRNIGSEITRM